MRFVSPSEWKSIYCLFSEFCTNKIANDYHSKRNCVHRIPLINSTFFFSLGYFNKNRSTHTHIFNNTQKKNISNNNINKINIHTNSTKHILKLKHFQFDISQLCVLVFSFFASFIHICAAAIATTVLWSSVRASIHEILYTCTSTSVFAMNTFSTAQHNTAYTHTCMRSHRVKQWGFWLLFFFFFSETYVQFV